MDHRISPRLLMTLLQPTINEPPGRHRSSSSNGMHGPKQHVKEHERRLRLGLSHGTGRWNCVGEMRGNKWTRSRRGSAATWIVLHQRGESRWSWSQPWCLCGRTGILKLELESTAFLAHFTIPSRLHSDGRSMTEQRRKEQHYGANWPPAREQ